MMTGWEYTQRYTARAFHQLNNAPPYQDWSSEINWHVATPDHPPQDTPILVVTFHQKSLCGHHSTQGTYSPKPHQVLYECCGVLDVKAG